MINPVRAESIRALYAQMRAAGAASLIGVAYMIGAAALFTPWPSIVAWSIAMLVVQVARQLLIYNFYKRNPCGDTLERWARAFVGHQAFAGVVWGSSMILFAHPEEAESVSLVLCGAIFIVTGAVPAQAYTPSSFRALNISIMSMVVGRLLTIGEPAFILLGAISAVFALAMNAFCNVQARLVNDVFRVRFENETLLQQVTMQKAEAEDARGKAEAASLAKSQFLAAASHDLRQPLYALSLFSTSLGALRLDDDGQRVVAQIQDSVAAMESLFVGLLDLSRLDAGVVKAQVTAVSIDALFDRLSQYYHPAAVERGLELRFRSDGEWIESDATLLEQVLSNLVSNAIRYTKRGAVLIAARRRGENLRLEVWDTGVGIDDGDRQRIFQQFVQIGNPERDRRKGLGLGLSIAQRSADLIGGQVTVKSWPQKGSRFTILQPLTAAPSALSSTNTHLAPQKVRASTVSDLPVLIVEDDRSVRAALHDLLTRWGSHFDMVSDASEALVRIAAGKQYRSVIADYRLPGSVNGLDLLKTISQREQHQPPIFCLITGDFDPGLISAAKALGIALLHKPVKASTLRELIGA